MPQRTFSVKVSDDFLARIDASAEEAGLCRHAFVREAIRAALAGDAVERRPERRIGDLIRARMAADQAAAVVVCRGEHEGTQ